MLYATGYKPRETTDLLLELDFKNFLDDSWGVVRDLRRVSRKYGWHKGDFFRNWIGERIRELDLLRYLRADALAIKR